MNPWRLWDCRLDPDWCHGRRLDVAEFDEGSAERDLCDRIRADHTDAPRRGHARTLPFPRWAAHPAGSDVAHCVDHNNFRHEA